MVVLHYLLALLGITLLCALWMRFQLWLKRVDPQRDGFKPGCGACKNGSCGTAPSSTETTIKFDSIAPEKQGIGESPFGEIECEEKKSP